MANMATTKPDWRAEYAKAAALEDEVAAGSASQTSKAPEDRVLAFLDRLLDEEGGECWSSASRRCLQTAVRKAEDPESNAVEGYARKQLKAARRRLAVVANALVVVLPTLNASLNDKVVPRAAKVRVLQLQLVCRMLRYGVLLTKKRKGERKAAKKEIRGLMDRVALLLDATNPPSLADEDVDERSPFQEFLQSEVAPRLCELLPDLIRYLLVTYELEEAKTPDVHSKELDGDASSQLLSALRSGVKEPEPPVAPTPAEPAAKQSILSALRQERPAKRARLETGTPFKEMQLPHQLQLQQRQQQHRRHRKSQRVSSSDTTRKSSATSKSKRKSTAEGDLLRAAAAEGKLSRRPKSLGSTTTPRSSAASSSATRLTPSARKPGDTDLLRRAARPSAPKAPSSARLLGPGAGRSSFLSQPHMTATATAGPSPAGAKATSKTQLQARPGVAASAPARRATSASVVMRTPDRPKRRGVRSAARVLVEASPPFRNTNVAGSAARRLQSKPSSRTTKPSPLF